MSSNCRMHGSLDDRMSSPSKLFNTVCNFNSIRCFARCRGRSHEHEPSQSCHVTSRHERLLIYRAIRSSCVERCRVSRRVHRSTKVYPRRNAGDGKVVDRQTDRQTDMQRDRERERTVSSVGARPSVPSCAVDRPWFITSSNMAVGVLSLAACWLC